MTTDLDELEGLRAAATPGPWQTFYREDVGHLVNGPEPTDMEKALAYQLRNVVGPVNVAILDDYLASENAAFIVAACNNIGPLIERVREAEAKARITIYTREQSEQNCLLGMQKEADRADAAEARVKELEGELYGTKDSLKLVGNLRKRYRDRAIAAESRLAALEAGIRALAEAWDTLPEPPDEDYEGTREGHIAFGEWSALRYDGRKQLLALLKMSGTATDSATLRKRITDLADKWDEAADDDQWDQRQFYADELRALLTKGGE